MKLTQDVYLVGGGDYGFNLTHRLDCHVYVVDGGSELALIDAGFWPGTEEILALMKEDGLDPERVSTIVVTHYHADHSGGAAAIKREFADEARIKVGELELELVATPGHCMGHYCVRLAGRDRTYLFSSDCVFWGGAIILQNVKDSNVQDYAASCNRIAALEFDALLPGHHMISLRNGRRHAEAAANEFNRIGLPRDLLR